MSDLIQGIDTFFIDNLGFPSGVATKILVSVLLILSVRILLRVLRSFFRSQVADLQKRHITNRILSYSLNILLVVILLTYWVGASSGILAYFGLLSAGVAVALQDPLANFAGWLYILIARPFSTGERIQIDSHAGDVIDIRVGSTTILEIGKWVDADQSTGRVIHIPNGWFLKRPVANYNEKFNFIWHEMPVMVTFESNWEKALEILQEIVERNNSVDEESAREWLEQASHSYMIFYQKLSPVVWLTVADSGVVLTMRYLCEPKKRRSVQHRIWQDVLRAFAKSPDIDFAYPTRRTYFNHLEGKPEVGGPIRETKPTQDKEHPNPGLK